MKFRNNILLAIGLMVFLSISSCTNRCDECVCGDKINKRNLAGTWLIKSGTKDGVTLESGVNTNISFDKDGSYEDSRYTGTWEFGEFRNNIYVYTENQESFKINILEFSKKEMVIEKDHENGLVEYQLSKAD